jgi:predicted transcriptional regulator
MLNNAANMNEILRRQNSTTISRQAFPASLLYVSAGNCQRALVDESVMIRNKMGTPNRTEMFTVQGPTCARIP